MDIKIGADPELFLQHDGKYISAHGIIPGTKREPYTVDKGAVQVDGMALEFNIDPANNEDEFTLNVNTVLGKLREMVPKKFHMDYVPVVFFEEEYVKGQPEEARLLGCDPDFNAYTGEQNPPPDPNTSMRTASGHIHVGWTQDQRIDDPNHLDACRKVAIQLDYFLGLESLLFDTHPNAGSRRDLYGKAGSFRPKPYGMEYRVLSNFWLTSEEHISWVYKNTKKAIDLLVDYEFDVEKWALRKGLSSARYFIDKANYKPDMIKLMVLKLDEEVNNLGYYDEK